MANATMNDGENISDLDPSYFETFEDVCKKLDEIENKLAERFSVSTQTIRQHIIELERANQLEEDELVANWHELYSSYIDWMKYEATQNF